MTGAAIYARVSTARQAERDLSLPDQIAQCRAYCERQGWEVVEVFCEPGASALDDDRAVFQEMIYKATRPDRPFTFIVVHSLSRFQSRFASFRALCPQAAQGRSGARIDHADCLVRPERRDVPQAPECL